MKEFVLYENEGVLGFYIVVGRDVEVYALICTYPHVGEPDDIVEVVKSRCSEVIPSIIPTIVAVVSSFIVNGSFPDLVAVFIDNDHKHIDSK